MPGAIISTGFQNASADANGNYELRGLPPGKLQLSAYAPGLASQFDVVLSLGLADQRAGVDIHLAPATDISGELVYASDDTPVENAAVNLTDEHGSSRQTVSDKAGQFTLLGVPQGPHNMHVSAAGCMEVVVPINADAENTIVRLDCGFWIRGRVTPPMKAKVSGRPPDTAPPALLTANPITLERTTTSEEDGTFSLGPLDADEIILEAEGENGWEGSTTVDASSFDGEIEVRLEERYRVQGVLVDEDGEKVARATVEAIAIDADGDGAVDLRTAETATTGSEGDFVLRGLVAGAYELTVIDSNRQQLGVAHPENGTFVIAERDLEGVRFEVQGNDESIVGRVSATDGDVADVWVQARRAERSERFIRVGRNLSTREEIGEDAAPVLADTDGEFRLDGLRSGAYRVEASRADGSAYGTADGVFTGDSVSITLNPAGRVVGQVLQERQPVSPFRLDIRGASESTILVSASDGRFESDGLQPGEYKVFVSRPGESTGPGEVIVVESGEETRVFLSLVPMTSVRGQLLDDEGRPLGGVTIIPRFLEQSSPFRPSSAIADAAGRFVLQAPPGVLRLVVYGYPSHQHRVTISGGASELGQLKPISGAILVEGPVDP